MQGVQSSYSGQRQVVYTHEDELTRYLPLRSVKFKKDTNKEIAYDCI